jgi:hypothetical protein
MMIVSVVVPAMANQEDVTNKMTRIMMMKIIMKKMKMKMIM